MVTKNDLLASVQRSNDENTGPSTGFALQDGITDSIIKIDGKAHHTFVSSTEKGQPEIVDDEDDDDFPEGGWRAYLVVFGSFMAITPAFGTVNSLGAIQAYLATHQLQYVSSSRISWIFSIFCAMSFFSCVTAGSYFDRNGSRDPLLVGSIFFVAGLVACADCHNVYQFILAFSILSGMGTGIIATPALGVIATWFKKNRGTATSCATIGGSIGGIIIPPMLKKLYIEVGWAWAMRIFALFSTLCCTIALFLAKERKTTQPEPFKTYTEMLKFYFNSSFNWRYLLDGKFIFTAMGSSLTEASLTAALTFISSYSMAIGNSENTSYNLITVYNACGILGRYLPGYLADKYFGRFNMMILTLTISVLVQLVIWLPAGTNVKALWAFVGLFGFFTGSILSLTPVCIGQISRTVDFGKRYSTAYFIEALLILPILPIGGAIIDDGSIKNYNKFIVFSSMIMLAGGICFVIARYICVGFRYTKF